MSEAGHTPSIITSEELESPFSDTSSEAVAEALPLSERIQHLTEIEHLLASAVLEASRALSALRPQSGSVPKSADEFTGAAERFLMQLEVSKCEHHACPGTNSDIESVSRPQAQR